MGNYNIHICSCGAEPKLRYYGPSSWKKIQVKCPNCGQSTHPAIRNSMEAINKWNERFD